MQPLATAKTDGKTRTYTEARPPCLLARAIARPPIVYPGPARHDAPGRALGHACRRNLRARGIGKPGPLANWQKLAQVKKYSASLRTLFQVLFGLLAIAGLVALAIVAISREGNVDIAGRIYRGDELTPLIRSVGVVGIVLGMGLALKLNYHLIRLFDLYARGRIFMADNVRQIRQIGISVFLFILLWVFDLIAKVVLPSVDAGGSEAARGIEINLGGAPLGLAVAGIVIMIVSWIMDVGRELREEQDLTV